MPKFFVNKTQIKDGWVTIVGEDAHHISRSLRMAAGERISVSDMQRQEYECVLREFLPDSVRAEVIGTRQADTEPEIKIHLYQALPKGEKKSAILIAEGEKESAILRADAQKQSHILEAEGQAEAILKVQQATAEGIRMINDAAPTNSVIAIKGLEAFAKAADGKATKIIIPSEIQSLAGLATSFKEVISEK